MNDAGEDALAAGDFSSWLRATQHAIRGERAAEVPCGACTACCTSSQFIHIGTDESDTLARIPAELLFPAPRLPPGHVVLGYDERGHADLLPPDAAPRNATQLAVLAIELQDLFGQGDDPRATEAAVLRRLR